MEEKTDEVNMKTKTLTYDTIPTRLGPVHIAYTDYGLAGMQIGGSAAAWRRRLQRKFSIARSGRPAAIRKAGDQIRAYLSGKRRAFQMRIDWRGMSPFQHRVLRAALRIPYGRTTTYGQIASAVGNPKAARAVGRALGANPLPLVVPCHRVIAGDGSLGGYSAAGGVRVKRRLLNLERGE
jgi:methylated-DNA-[protein]-cysteine S-methyltransferase